MHLPSQLQRRQNGPRPVLEVRPMYSTFLLNCSLASKRYIRLKRKLRPSKELKAHFSCLTNNSPPSSRKSHSQHGRGWQHRRWPMSPVSPSERGPKRYTNKWEIEAWDQEKEITKDENLWPKDKWLIPEPPPAAHLPEGHKRPIILQWSPVRKLTSPYKWRTPCRSEAPLPAAWDYS
jgi:hypothetical protein